MSLLYNKTVLNFYEFRKQTIRALIQIQPYSPSREIPCEDIEIKSMLMMYRPELHYRERRIKTHFGLNDGQLPYPINS